MVLLLLTGQKRHGKGTGDDTLQAGTALGTLSTVNLCNVAKKSPVTQLSRTRTRTRTRTRELSYERLI